MPESMSVPELFLARTKTASSISKVCESITVCVPSTCKLPFILTVTESRSMVPAARFNVVAPDDPVPDLIL